MCLHGMAKSQDLHLCSSSSVQISTENAHAKNIRFQGRKQVRSCIFYYKGNLPCCLRSGLSLFNWWVSFVPDFQKCYFCESSCLFYLRFNFDFYVSKIMHLRARNHPRKPTTKCKRSQSRTKGEGWLRCGVLLFMVILVIYEY